MERQQQEHIILFDMFPGARHSGGYEERWHQTWRGRSRRQRGADSQQSEATATAPTKVNLYEDAGVMNSDFGFGVRLRHDADINGGRPTGGFMGQQKGLLNELQNKGLWVAQR